MRTSTTSSARRWASWQLTVFTMGLLPDTWNCGLCMRLECRERFPRYRLQRKPPVSNPGMHHGTCVAHVPRCKSGSPTCGGGENVPGIPVACATRNFTYLARDPWHPNDKISPIIKTYIFTTTIKLKKNSSNKVSAICTTHSGETDEANCNWLHPVWPPPKWPDQGRTFCVVSRVSTELIFVAYTEILLLGTTCANRVD